MWNHLRAVLACLALAGCGVLSNTSIGPAEIANARAASGNDVAADAEALVRPLVTEGRTPGVVVGVLAPDGSTRFFGYGVTDHASGTTPDADTLFAVGSLSKGFVAAATASLVNEGRLGWADTLATRLRDAGGFSPDARRVTLRQLASHTAGMPRQPVDPFTMLLFARYLVTGENFYGHLNRFYAYDYLRNFEADRPGEQHYSNIGYGILAEVLAQATGLSAEALVQQRVIQPLGLRCTGYVPADLPCQAHRAMGHAGDQPALIRRGNPAPDWQFTNLMRPSAGLHSTARDLLALAAAHLRPGASPLHAALAENARPHAEGTGEAVANAWFVEQVAGVPVTFQVGFVAGYSGYIGLDTTHGSAVVILQNSFNGDLRPGHLLLLRMAQRAGPPA